MRQLLLALLLVLTSSLSGWAGPPYITNDPDPPDPGQFEIIPSAASLQAYKNNTQNGGFLSLEVNYGADARTQLSVGVPSAFGNSNSNGFQYGVGDVYLEYKHRFGDDEQKSYFGVDPTISFPTGGQLGAGSGRVLVDLPVLYQYKVDKNTVVYTDMRYRWHASANGGSYVYWGAVVERDVSDTLTLGAELYNTTRNELYTGAPDVSNQGFNLGLRYKLNEHATFILSAGRSFEGDPLLTLFVGVIVLTTPPKHNP